MAERASAGQNALDRAVRALARRDHSTVTLRAKLERAGIPPVEQAAVVETLERLGYLDDGRFARHRAAQLAARGYGDEWIRGDLAAQGVPADVAEAALGALEPEAERAVRQASALGDRPGAARVLARRGFSEETVEAVLAEDLGGTVG